MAEVQLASPDDGQPVPRFRIDISSGMMGPITSPVITHTKGLQVALDDDGRLVHNGTVVSGSLAVDSWYTPFITTDGHLRVRREDGQLEPYTGPDALIVEPPPPVTAPAQVCGRQRSGEPESTCVLAPHEGKPWPHRTADGGMWVEPWVDPDTQVTGTCKAALMIKGEHFPCDWQHTSPDGTHKGWAHTNKRAEAIWSND